MARSRTNGAATFARSSPKECSADGREILWRYARTCAPPTIASAIIRFFRGFLHPDGQIRRKRRGDAANEWFEKKSPPRESRFSLSQAYVDRQPRARRHRLRCAPAAAKRTPLSNRGKPAPLARQRSIRPTNSC